MAGFLVTAVAAWCLFGWTSRLEVAIVLLIICLWIFGISVLSKGRATRPRLADVGRLRMKSLFVGIANGLIASLLLFMLFVVFRHSAGYQRFVDGDRVHLEETTAKLCESGEYERAANEVSRRLQGELSDDWKSELQQRHVELLTFVATNASSPEHKRKLWDTVRRLGNQYGITVSVPNDIKANSGRALTQGTTGEIIEVVSDVAGQSTIHVAVEQDGKFVPSLRTEDFSIRCDGKETVSFSVTEGRRKDSRRWDTVVLMDCSESTSKLRNAMESAILELVAASSPQSMFRIATFSSTTQFATDWTNDRETIRSGLTQTKWGGKSSLRPSTAAAIRELRQRDGVLTLILMSDGHNNVGGKELSNDDLVALCRQAEIKIVAVGLEHAELQEETLRYLANQTSGQYYKVSQASFLVRGFANAQTKLGEPVYLLSPSEPVSGIVNVQVGSGRHALQLMASADPVNNSL